MLKGGSLYRVIVCYCLGITFVSCKGLEVCTRFKCAKLIRQLNNTFLFYWLINHAGSWKSTRKGYKLWSVALIQTLSSYLMFTYFTGKYLKIKQKTTLWKLKSWTATGIALNLACTFTLQVNKCLKWSKQPIS